MEFEAAKDDAFDQGIEVANQRRGVGDRSLFPQFNQLREGGSLEGALAGQNFVEDEAERIDIAPGADFAASKLLRCHIGWRARADFRSLDGRGDAGESKVGDANLSGSIEHDVCRLQVAVNHAAFVCCRKTRANLPRDLRGLIRRKPTDSADDRGEIFSIDILHRQKKGSIGFADVKHAADVGVRDLPGGSHFGMKSCQRSGILSKRFRQKLQRHDLTERHIFGAVDFAHSSSAGQRHNAVALRDNLAGCKAAAADGVGTRRGIAAGRRSRSSRG